MLKNTRLLLKIGNQARKVASPPLNLHMLPFINVVNAHVDFVPTGRVAGDLFADEKVRVLAETLSRIDRIVIGYSDQIQPPVLELLVEDFRGIIALATKTANHRHRSHAGVDSVDV